MTSVPSPKSGWMAGRAQGLTAVTVAIGAFLILTVLATFSLRSQIVVARNATSIRLEPDVTSVASNNLAGNLSKNTRGRPLDAYTAAALRNLTNFQDRLLAIGVPFFGVTAAAEGKDKAPNLWELLSPVIACPPDQPLSRYGGEGDGSKQLCKLQAQQRACVIYSLGSNGKPYQLEHHQCAAAVLTGASGVILLLQCCLLWLYYSQQ